MECGLLMVCALYVGIIALIWKVAGSSFPKYKRARKQFFLSDMFIITLIYCGWLMLAVDIIIGRDAPDLTVRLITWAILLFFCAGSGFLFATDMYPFSKRKRFRFLVWVFVALFPVSFLMVVPLWLLWKGYFK